MRGHCKPYRAMLCQSAPGRRGIPADFVRKRISIQRHAFQSQRAGRGSGRDGNCMNPGSLQAGNESREGLGGARHGSPAATHHRAALARRRPRGPVAWRTRRGRPRRDCPRRVQRAAAAGKLAVPRAGHVSHRESQRGPGAGDRQGLCLCRARGRAASPRNRQLQLAAVDRGCPVPYRVFAVERDEGGEPSVRGNAGPGDSAPVPVTAGRALAGGVAALTPAGPLDTVRAEFLPCGRPLASGNGTLRQTRCGKIMARTARGWPRADCTKR